MSKKSSKKSNIPNQVDLTETEVEELKKKILEGKLSDGDQALLVNILQGFIWLNKMFRAKQMSMNKLMRLFGFRSEKKKDDDDDKKPGTGAGGSNEAPKGHGKNGQDKYSDAKRVYHEHETLKSGDRCPECQRGNLYEIPPGSFVNITGNAPLSASVHLAQKLRCNTCGEIFTAKAPESKKYDETADVAIAILKYGTGTPFYRLDGLQNMLGVPMPRSTLWDRVENLGDSVYPVYERLKKEAALGELTLIDDTTARILDLKKQLKAENAERTGIYTTGIISRLENRVINLFFTGNRYAGENLGILLKDRPLDMGRMIQMSDALPSNRVKGFSTIESLCWSHARRNFVDLGEDNSKDTRHAVSLIGKIYHFDNLAKKRKYDKFARLAWHQKKSTLILKKLRRWCLKCFYLKRIEPNDPLGQAILYILNHWEKLTEFLRTAGVPLDNNATERLLKRPILHRKNSLFFKSQLGAYVGDTMMSLIETCRAAKKNPFEYLVSLHKNRKKVFANPERWFPWNYEANLI